MISLSGCDRIRRSFGLPDSSDIKKAERELSEKASAESSKSDSVAYRADTVAAVKEISSRESSEFGTASSGNYYVILGSFKEDGNAAKFGKIVRQAIGNAYIIHNEYGFDMVGVGPYGDIKSACNKKIDLLDNHSFCPDDVWIYYNK